MMVQAFAGKREEKDDDDDDDDAKHKPQFFIKDIAQHTPCSWCSL